MEILAGFDVVVDGADNFPSRYLLNDASVKLGIPVVHGSIFRFEGQVTVFDPRNGPTYRDLLPVPPPAGVRPVLRRGRRARRPARHHRLAAGAGGHQADPGPRRRAAGPHPGVRRPRDGLPRVQAAGRPRQPRHLGEPRPDRDRRARGAVHAPPEPRLPPERAAPDGRSARLCGRSSLRWQGPPTKGAHAPSDPLAAPSSLLFGCLAALAVVAAGCGGSGGSTERRLARRRLDHRVLRAGAGRGVRPSLHHHADLSPGDQRG